MLKFIKKKNVKETYTQERCHVLELVNDAECSQMSLTRCRVEPGVQTQLHALKNVRETYYIESGEGVMDDGVIAGIDVRVGDAIVIEPEQPQRILNTGKSDLIFMVVCNPRFVPECYINLEEDKADAI